MSLETWGWDIFSSDEAESGPGEISIGKSKKGGDNRQRQILITDRWIYREQKLLDALLAEPGDPKAKRAISLQAEELRKAVAHAKRDEYRDEILREHGLKAAQTHPGRKLD